jgi:hypothetical protein
MMNGVYYRVILLQTAIELSVEPSSITTTSLQYRIHQQSPLAIVDSLLKTGMITTTRLQHYIQYGIIAHQSTFTADIHAADTRFFLQSTMAFSFGSSPERLNRIDIRNKHREIYRVAARSSLAICSTEESAAAT